MQPLLTTGQGAGGVPGSISLPDYGGGQRDNALRYGLNGILKKGEVNPYFPNGLPSQNGLSVGGAPNYGAALSGQGGFQQVGNQVPPPFQGPMPNTGTTVNNATGQPVNTGTPAWMNTPQGQQYMQALMNKTGGIVAGGNTGAPQTGLIGSEQALMQALTGATGTLDNAAGVADGYLGNAQDSFGQYINQGTNALNLQADLSGVNGQAAFDTAFSESPVQKFLREQGERSVTQNASALGGLGGGNVMKELTRFGQGNASTELQRQIDNLSNITGLGFNATGATADILGNRSDLAYNTGANKAQAIGTVGQIIAGDRNQAGQAQAAAIGSTTSALSDLMNQQGAGLSDITGTNGGNLANLLAGYGSTSAQSSQNMATILANILAGQGSQVSGLPGIPGTQQTGGIMDDIAALTEAGATAYLASDRRLKTNIKKVGETPGGTSLYEWDWTGEAKAIVGNQPSWGVMADEVDPAIVAVASDGYMRVDYARVV